MSKPSLSTLLLDYRKGSKNLSLYEPLRSLLSPCPNCSGIIGPSWKLNRSSPTSPSTYYNRLPNGKEAKPFCSYCYDTGRELSTLPSADVSFTGYSSPGPIPIGVEVKSTSDLISSVSSGRLQATQIPTMLNDYDLEGRWILQYGLYRPSPRDGLIQEWSEGRGWYTLEIGGRVTPYSYLEKFKMSPSLLELGFRVVRVNSIQEAAYWLVDLYKEWTKPYHTHKSLCTIDRSQGVEARLKREEEKNNRLDRAETNSSDSNGFTKGSAHSSMPHHDKDLLKRLKVVNTFPNLGFARARAVAAHYTSINEMMEACKRGEIGGIELEVGGNGRKVRIGEKTAKRIQEYVS